MLPLSPRPTACALALAGVLVCAPLADLGAQAGSAAPQSATPQSGAPYPQAAPDGPPAAQGGNLQRQQLEQRVRQRFEQIVRQRLHLTDEQLTELRQTNQHFAAPRRALAERERGLRQAMRQELRDGDAANQPLLASQIDSIFALQRSRLDLLMSEQRELARFLTPAQRVQYYALQEQLRLRVEQMRRQQLALQRGFDGGGGGAAGAAPYGNGAGGGGGGGGRGRRSAGAAGVEPGADTLQP